ncbi:MAG: class I SAM-dependent methyltransferase [Geminicoccaceae bacterium]
MAEAVHGPRCAACGALGLEPFYAVPAIPVHSCLLVESRAAALDFPTGDLELAFCPACGFIGNRRFDPAVHDYSPDYEESQGFSPRFRKFLDGLADDQVRRHGLADRTVLEIGCGKGDFLVTLCEHGAARGIGIDPAYRPERTQSAVADRLRFIRDFYGPDHASLVADHIVCRHTLEHIADVRGFLELIRRDIGARTNVTLFFELPDMERILVERAFWDIYYEHCSYFTAGALARLFRRTGFGVSRVWKAYDDQYLMLEAVAGGPTTAALRPDAEDVALIGGQVAAFAAGIARRLDELRAQVAGWRRDGRKVVLWGSGSKATGYLTTLGLREEIAAVVDINPFRHGKYVAGTGHEIVAPASLAQLRPDIVVVMNPIYVEEIGADLRRMDLAPEIIALS